MTPWAKPVSVSIWLLSLCFITLAGVRRLSYLQLVTPQAAAPGLPKWLSVEKVDDLLLSVYDSDTRRLVPRNGYNQDRQHFWRQRSAECLGWESWVDNTYQFLVREVNTSAPRAEPYYMQILHSCAWDDATGTIQAITRYSLNGEEVLRYQSDQNRWFSVHPAAWPLAERWNQAREIFADLPPEHCIFIIEASKLFVIGKTAQPKVRVARVPGTQARPRRLICHVTGFYPRDIEVTWERGSQMAKAEQLSSGILPNGDPTFQIQVSMELGQEEADPAEHVCVVRHSSLGNTPLRVTCDSQPTGLAGVLWIVAVCVLAVLAVGALVCSLWKWPEAWKGPYHPAPTQPGTLDSAPTTAKSSCTTVYSSSGER